MVLQPESNSKQDLQDSIYQFEIKEEMLSNAEQPGYSQLPEMLADVNIISVSEESHQDDQLFGCGKCATYFKESDVAKTCFYSHTDKTLTVICNLITRFNLCFIQYFHYINYAPI